MFVRFTLLCIFTKSPFLVKIKTLNFDLRKLVGGAKPCKAFSSLNIACKDALKIFKQKLCPYYENPTRDSHVKRVSG